MKENQNVSAEEQENIEVGHNNKETESAEKHYEKAAEESSEEKEQNPVEDLQDENAKLKDQLLRTIAEFDNFRKRTNKEKAELILNGGRKAVTDILPILDDFERALSNETKDATAIKEGMQMIFNTDYHEAVAMVPGMGDDKKGKVIDCVQSGYTMNDKVIRHAKVAVGQ